MTGYVVLEVDPHTLRPVTGPILGWGRDMRQAVNDTYENTILDDTNSIEGFLWDGPEDPDGQDVWEHDWKTGIVRPARLDKTAKLILGIEPDLKRWAVSKAEEWGDEWSGVCPLGFGRGAKEGEKMKMKELSEDARYRAVKAVFNAKCSIRGAEIPKYSYMVKELEKASLRTIDWGRIINFSHFIRKIEGEL